MDHFFDAAERTGSELLLDELFVFGGDVDGHKKTPYILKVRVVNSIFSCWPSFRFWILAMFEVDATVECCSGRA